MPDKKKVKKDQKDASKVEPEEYGAFQIEEREANVDAFEVDDSDGDGGEGAYNEKKQHSVE